MSFVQIERDQLESISIALCEAYEALEKHAEYQSALGEAHFEPVNTEAFVREKVGDTCDSLEYFLKRLAESAQQAQEPVTRCGGRGYCDRMPFCGCGGPEGLPERDPTKPAEAQGLFRKFIVQRVDGSDKQGGKHYDCEYFVLDVDHDPHAKVALQAYAQACAEGHPQLSADLIAKHVPAPKQAEPEGYKLLP